MRLIVGIATHRAGAVLSPSLQTPVFLKALAQYDSTLVVISQQHPIDFPEKLTQEIGRVIYRHNLFNRGCGGVRQQIADIALTLVPSNRAGAAVVFLDDDIHLTEQSWLANLLAPLEAGKADIAGIEPMRVTRDGYTTSDEEQPEYVSGGWAAVRLSVFERCQFDPRFVRNYWEDVDFGYQARAQGFKIAGVPCVGIEHRHIGDVDSIAFSENRERWLTKWRMVQHYISDRG